jgi:hypothetical protein
MAAHRNGGRPAGGDEMSDDRYERLAAALDSLANGFPRTESNVELRILRAVFTPDEAEVAGALTDDRPPSMR